MPGLTGLNAAGSSPGAAGIFTGGGQRDGGSREVKGRPRSNRTG